MHREEYLNSPIRFAGGDVPLSDYCKGFGIGAEPTSPHTVDEGPESLVIAQTASDVDGVVEGGGDVCIGRVIIEGLEELEGFGAVVPEELEDSVDAVWGPFDWVFF